MTEVQDDQLSTAFPSHNMLCVVLVIPRRNAEYLENIWLSAYECIRYCCYVDGVLLTVKSFMRVSSEFIAAAAAALKGTSSPALFVIKTNHKYLKLASGKES